MNQMQRRRAVTTAVTMLGILTLLCIASACSGKNPPANDDKSAANKQDYTMTLYTAEMIPWSEVNSLWKSGDNLKVYDVKTGKVWLAQRCGGQNHARIEPLTAADTAVLCEIYGVSSASQIGFECRPSYITIGTRTIAGSVCAEEQGSPAEDSIPENDYNGYACMHFKGSVTDDTKAVDSNHQKAIQYAWENCPVGHK